MTAQRMILILTVCLIVCMAALILGAAYFLRQWNRLDQILDNFRQGDLDEGSEGEDGYPDVLETRESRVVSQLRQILSAARFQKRQAAGERDQVMALISDLSHQLKTPLANIIMNTELLQDASLEQARREEFLAHTKEQADKMQWLMADLLKASRLENGMIRFPVEAAGIKETIARSLGHVYGQAAAKDIALAVEEFQDFNLIHNPKWTAEALANILENAIKYSPRHSRIHVSVTRLDLYTKITIADEGIGISEKEYNLIFKRFYRSGMVEQQEGSGLGLYLAQLIVLQEKGYITVASRVGQGSRFSLFLLNA